MFKSKFIKRPVTAILIIALLLVIIKQKDMTLRQSVLKIFYPVLMAFNKSKSSLQNELSVTAPVSFYSLNALDNKGNNINFEQFRGKKILLVNTASDCGYTGQYDELEKLYTRFKGRLVILGFPANDFKEQEKGDDKEIAQFCKLNYNITFPLMKKSTVVKGSQQNEIYKWLSVKNKNGWNNQQPVWNFSKYLVDENGVLQYYFAPAVSPLSDEIIKAIEK